MTLREAPKEIRNRLNENPDPDPFAALRRFELARRKPGNLPIQTTPLVDREREFEALLELLRKNARLITLTGPGGTGKTRLALELASRVKDEFLDGTFFVSLGSITESALVAPALISALEIMEKASESAEETLADFLKNKQLLLLLDNFEQVISAAILVAHLLRECNKIKIIVTSRAPLRVQGEFEFPLPPLGVPGGAKISKVQELEQYAAVTLFVQRTQAILPDFTITSQNTRLLADICTRLDGLPLALELAAARTRILGLPELFAHLQNRLDLLSSGRRDLPVRHQTLRNAIAWSYDLLNDHEKRLFRRLSVFAGNFSLEAVERTCMDSQNELDTIEQLSSLVESSLLLSEHDNEEVRFRILGTIREFGREALTTSGESLGVQRRFSEFFAKLAQDMASELMGPRQAEMLARLDLDIDNFRAALNWLIENGETKSSLDFASALWNFWNIRGYNTEGRIWLTKALEKAGPIRSESRARALVGAGGLAIWQDDFTKAASLLNEALSLSRELGDKRDEASALNYLANVADDIGNFLDARRMHEESLALFRALHDKWGEASVLNNLGVGARYQGNYEEAIEFQKESLRLFTELGDKRRIAHSLINLGSLHERRGEYDSAREMITRSVALFRELNGKVGIAESCLLLGIVSRKQHQYEEGRKHLAESLIISKEVGNKEIIVNCLEEFAAFEDIEGRGDHSTQLLSAADFLRENIPFPIPPAYLEDKQNIVTTVRSKLGEERFSSEWRKGRMMSLEEAIAYALDIERPNS